MNTKHCIYCNGDFDIHSGHWTGLKRALTRANPTAWLICQKRQRYLADIKTVRFKCNMCGVDLHLSKRNYARNTNKCCKKCQTAIVWEKRYTNIQTKDVDLKTIARLLTTGTIHKDRRHKSISIRTEIDGRSLSLSFGEFKYIQRLLPTHFTDTKSFKAAILQYILSDKTRCIQVLGYICAGDAGRIGTISKSYCTSDTRNLIRPLLDRLGFKYRVSKVYHQIFVYILQASIPVDGKWIIIDRNLDDVQLALDNAS